MVEVDRTYIQKTFFPISSTKRIESVKRREGEVYNNLFKRHLIDEKERDGKKKRQNKQTAKSLTYDEKKDEKRDPQFQERINSDSSDLNREDSPEDRIQGKLIDVKV